MTNGRVVIAGFSSLWLASLRQRVDPILSSDSRVTIHEADATNFENLRKALKGATTFVCCYLGEDSLMVEGQKLLIDACITEQVPRYFASDYSFDFRNLKRDKLPHKDCQIDIYEHLQQLGKHGKIKPVHILNGAFAEAFVSAYMGIIDPESKSLHYWGSGEEVWEVTTVENMAEFTVEAIANPGATGLLRVQGDFTSALHLGRLVEDVYDVKLRYEKLGSLEDLYKALQESKSARPNEPFAWLGLAYNYHIINGQTLMRGNDNSMFPDFRPETLKEFLKTHSLPDLPNLYAATAKM
ncbi:hypothetical protein M409DRAFT_21374 [Zasmidium cellare ATCC 36951]|uniref:NmrA-like domain-containing protein n=1 Tax=Zasmidium cellare ATCC 36951 TaxID=1080233 RepID=A0A6A6CS88_ZASCE|nr:uncharacterized protein M409DRAFT_21374 [Zasmidium cellare ATCC 36951]KAF2168629.1 hypothetical protein M409DRAFT_21374 [Zasmidium cellare ATCC 36951]